MMERKLILPAEVKVCATCSYWDGERTVDPELRVVVVAERCEGVCLVREKSCSCVLDVRNQKEECFWEHLAPDLPEEVPAESAAGEAFSEPSRKTGT